MKVHEIMTAHARCVGPDNTLVEAAGLMRELDVGALPVCDDERLAGMVTDRDIAIRGVADGRDPNSTPVREVMSQGIIYVLADEDVEEAARVMEEKQIRRLPVLNREKRLVGIVSLGDIATSSNPAFSGTALRDVSQPAHSSARQQRLRQGAIDLVPTSGMGNDRGRSRKTSGRGERGRSTTSRRNSSSQAKRKSATKQRSSGAKKSARGRRTTARSRG